MKKWICALAAISMLTLGSTAYAADSVKIMVEDKPIKTDAAPILNKGRVLVPIRVVSEALGASVAWDQNTKTATISKWSEKVKLTVGENKAMVYGKMNDSEALSLDVSIQNINNRVFVPLRFLSQFYGYNVEWKNNTVSIHSPLSARQQAVLYNGDLITSRKLAMSLSNTKMHYEHTPLTTLHEHEDYSQKYLFPEGEALRFYKIEGNETISFYEFKNDFPVVTWQAHIADETIESIQALLDNKLKDSKGSMPKMNKALLYYGTGFFGDSSWEESGQIDGQGELVITGYKRIGAGSIITDSGAIALKMPNETRQETVKIP